MRYWGLLGLLLVVPAMAAEPAKEPPTQAELLSQDKIQFGQLLIQLGNAELEISKLKKELADTKPKSEAVPH